MKKKQKKTNISSRVLCLTLFGLGLLIGILIGAYAAPKEDRFGKSLVKEFCKEQGYDGFIGFGKADYSYAESELYVHCYEDDLAKPGEFMCIKTNYKECKNPKFLGSEGNISNFPIDKVFEKSKPKLDAKFRYYKDPEGSAFWKCEEDD